MKFKIILSLIFFVLGCIVGAYITNLTHKSQNIEIDTIVEHSVIIEKIENLGKLEVVRYNVQDIVEYEKVRQWLPNAKTALQISGEIIACVDLSKIREEHVTLAGDSVVVILPRPEICHVKVDHSKSKVYDTSYGLWESAKLVDDAYKHAQQGLEQQAQKLDLTKEARENTAAIITPMLNALGFKHVTIVYDDYVFPKN